MHKLKIQYKLKLKILNGLSQISKTTFESHICENGLTCVIAPNPKPHADLDLNMSTSSATLHQQTHVCVCVDFCIELQPVNHRLLPTTWRSAEGRRRWGWGSCRWPVIFWPPCIFSIGCSWVVVFSRDGSTLPWSLPVYLKADKTYFLTIRCSLIALWLLLCLLRQDIPPLIYPSSFAPDICSQNCDDIEKQDDVLNFYFPEVKLQVTHLGIVKIPDKPLSLSP